VRQLKQMEAMKSARQKGEAKTAVLANASQHLLEANPLECGSAAAAFAVQMDANKAATALPQWSLYISYFVKTYALGDPAPWPRSGPMNLARPFKAGIRIASPASSRSDG
jgi:hypothetical protein